MGSPLARSEEANPRGPTVALHARARRPARARRDRRAPLPCRDLLAAGRLPRGRGLLRPQRLPHHRPPARGVADEGFGRREGVLDEAREEAPAGALPLDRGDARLRRGVLARRGRGPAQRRLSRVRVRDQLVPRPRPGVLLRGRGEALALETSLVARGRGAVLRLLATGLLAWGKLRRDALAHASGADGRARRGGDLRRADGRPLRTRCGPLPPLLRDGHPSGGAPDRGRPRHRLDARASSALFAGPVVPDGAGLQARPRTGAVPAPVEMDGADAARCPRPRRAWHARLTLPPPRRIRRAPLPRRARGRLARDRRPDHGPLPPPDAPRERPAGPPAAALDRGALLRHLSLALAGLHGHPSPARRVL